MKNILKYALLCITLPSATILGMDDPYYDDDAIPKGQTPAFSADEDLYVGSYNPNMLRPLPRVGDRSATQRNAAETKKQNEPNDARDKIPFSVPASDFLANSFLAQVKEKMQEIQKAIAAKGEGFEQSPTTQEILKEIDSTLEKGTSLSQQALEEYLETLGTVLESLS